MSDADCTPGREPRSVAASHELDGSTEASMAKALLAEVLAHCKA